MIPIEDKITVLDTLATILESKGRSKMTSLFLIMAKLRKANVEISQTQVESVLDILVQKRIVRYWKKEYKGKWYIYYGLSFKGWKKWDKLSHSIQKK